MTFDPGARRHEDVRVPGGPTLRTTWYDRDGRRVARVTILNDSPKQKGPSCPEPGHE